jgi:hypothetical protein
MEVAESAAGLLIYKELDYSCFRGGKHFSSISSGQRPNTIQFKISSKTIGKYNCIKLIMFIVILSNFGNTSRFFSAQNVVQYILDGTIQKAMEGNILVPFPAVNAQTKGKITYNIHVP